MGNTEAIRWDLGRMAELATNLDRKEATITAARLAAHDVLERTTKAGANLRSLALAGFWAGRSADQLRTRRELLTAAETELLWQLGDATSSGASHSPSGSRSITTISMELDVALAALEKMTDSGAAADRAELAVAELTLELAVAERNTRLMDVAVSEPGTLDALSQLIDFLSYEVARARPQPRVDWAAVNSAVDAIRDLLDESWFGDVGRHDLLAINAILGSLDGPELDATLTGISEDELYRWFHELDGLRGGNLDPAEEADLFATVAGRAGAATLFRLANAEGGSRFHEIAAAVAGEASVEVAMEFIEISAAAAAGSEAALIGALAGLAALDDRHRLVMLTSLQHQGLAVPLHDATTRLLAATATTRDSPIVVEFFKGLLGAVGGALDATAELTVVVLADRHRFREAWSRLGGVLSLAVHDPVQFAAVVLDINTMVHNPARWSGAVAVDLTTSGVSRFARLGRLGRAAGTAARWLRRLMKRQIVTIGALNVRVGHIAQAIERLGVAARSAEMRAVIAQLASVEADVATIGEIVAGLPGKPLDQAVDDLASAAALASGRIAAIAGALCPQPQPAG